MPVKAHDAIADLRARQIVATALAAAFSQPHAAVDRGVPASTQAALSSAWRLVALPHAVVDPSELQPGEVLPTDVDFRSVTRWLRLDPIRRERAGQHVFGLVISKPCSPCETDHLPYGDAFCRAQVLADITGFYRAFGVDVSSRQPQRPDHIVLELEFVAILLGKLADAFGDGAASERVDVCQRALASFMRDHLTTWLAGFGQLVARRAEDVAATIAEASEREDVALLGEVGRVVCAWIAAERRCAGLAPTRGIDVRSLPVATESNEACESCECP
ncbi:MAG: molecular chaperone TorD family protein [Phycisphaerae bacterium]|nr:molecular chaperone TorD family protein [Phycisphaerae bacterium]MCZ2401385.1 molecular chaperone TorD family protein [Phycisphaerae bacterium]